MAAPLDLIVSWSTEQHSILPHRCIQNNNHESSQTFRARVPKAGVQRAASPLPGTLPGGQVIGVSPKTRYCWRSVQRRRAKRCRVRRGPIYRALGGAGPYKRELKDSAELLDICFLQEKEQNG